MASSIAKQPWRLGLILFLLAAFVASLLAYQSFFTGSSGNEAAIEVTAGSPIGDAGTPAPLPGPRSEAPAPVAGGAPAAGSDAAGSTFDGLATTLATFSAFATPAAPVPGVPGFPKPDPPPAPPETGSLSGTVLTVAGTAGSSAETPLGNITVYLADAAFRLTGRTAATGSDGRFSFDGLAPGQYNVFFTDPAGSYRPAWYTPQTIVAGGGVMVAAGLDTGITMFLEPAGSREQTGAISGIVRNQVGKGIPGVFVMAYRIDETAGVSLSLESVAATDIDGRYEINGLPPEPAPGDASGKLAGYKIAFAPDFGSPYAQEWYEDQPSHATAKLLTLLAGEEVQNIDAILDGGGRIKGNISGGGLPLSGVIVDVFDESGVIAITVLTDAAGDYDSGPLAPGAYRVRASGATGFADEWYNDKSSFTSADPVNIIAGAESSGIDMVLSLVGQPVSAGSAGSEGNGAASTSGDAGASIDPDMPERPDDTSGSASVDGYLGGDPAAGGEGSPVTETSSAGADPPGGSDSQPVPVAGLQSAGSCQDEQSQVVADRHEQGVGAGQSCLDGSRSCCPELGSQGL